MSPKTPAAQARGPLAALTFLLLAVGPVQADDAQILRCSQIGDAAARLACFDQLAVQVRQRAAQPTAPAAQAAAQAAAPAPQAAATTASAGDRRVAEFGLPRAADAQPLQAIESRIDGRFEGWGPNTRLKLANGQVWQIVDGSRGPGNGDSPKVTIRRGALGALYLEIEGEPRMPRVRRVQ